MMHEQPRPTATRRRRTWPAAALLLLSVGNWQTAAAAALLRPMTTLTSGVVRLSDLFDDAGPQADKVLGPGPAPGSRLVVEAPQLAAIAHQFGVDWQPASPSVRAVLERPGRSLKRTEVLAALLSSFEVAGYSADCDIALPGFNPPIVAADTPSQVTVEQLDQDPGGEFTALVAVFSDGLPPMRMRITGRVQETVEVPVATRRLLPGTLLHEGDVRLARLRTGLIQTEVARSEADAVGHVLRHLSIPGQPFALVDLARPAVVQRGARVTMNLESTGIELSAQGIAIEPGGIGDQVGVRNPASGTIVQAEVTGFGTVRVMPGAVPMPLSQRGTPPVVPVR